MLKEIIGILGLIFIILGNLTISKGKKFQKKYTYPLFITGGILLTIYSFFIKNFIFLVLQIIYTIVSVFGLIKMNKNE